MSKNKNYNYKYKSRIKTKIIFLLIFSIFIINLNFNNINSTNNFLDTNIKIFNDGSVNINSISNLNYLKNISHSQNFTYKKKEYWTFEIHSEKLFNKYKFTITLPQNTEINYIKTTPKIKFENYNNQIKIIGEGTNSKLNIILQYKINSNKNQFKNINEKYFNYNYIILIILIIIIILITFRINKYSQIKNKNKNNKETNNFDISLLPERQKEIIKILKKNDKITQKKLEELMEIPKSSISRNLKTLEIKNIIKKEKIGNTNYIILKI